LTLHECFKRGGYLECYDPTSNDIIHVFHLSGTPYLNVSKGVDILTLHECFKRGGYLECYDPTSNDIIHVFHLSGTPYLNVSKGVDILTLHECFKRGGYLECYDPISNDINVGHMQASLFPLFLPLHKQSLGDNYVRFCGKWLLFNWNAVVYDTN
jgi:hypothetical protein